MVPFNISTLDPGQPWRVWEHTEGLSAKQRRARRKIENPSASWPKHTSCWVMTPQMHISKYNWSHTLPPDEWIFTIVIYKSIATFKGLHTLSNCLERTEILLAVIYLSSLGQWTNNRSGPFHLSIRSFSFISNWYCIENISPATVASLPEDVIHEPCSSLGLYKRRSSCRFQFEPYELTVIVLCCAWFRGRLHESMDHRWCQVLLSI